MRDPARELAEAFQPLGLQYLRLRLLPLLAFERLPASAAPGVGLDVGPLERFPPFAAPGPV